MQIFSYSSWFHQNIDGIWINFENLENQGENRFFAGSSELTEEGKIWILGVDMLRESDFLHFVLKLTYLPNSIFSEKFYIFNMNKYNTRVNFQKFTKNRKMNLDSYKFGPGVFLKYSVQKLKFLWKQSRGLHQKYKCGGICRQIIYFILKLFSKTSSKL